MFSKFKPARREDDAEEEPAGAADPDSAAPDEKTLLAGELRAAQRIQRGLVPRTFPPIPGCLPFDLYAILEPAREIGGDFYDFWMNGREHLTLVIGDVSGKGIPAALFMAVCRTYLRAFSRSVREPAKLLKLVNDELSRHNESCMFVTLAVAVVHIPTGRVEYAGAGHNPPFLRRRDGQVLKLTTAANTPVGFMRDVSYDTGWLRLEPGDFLLFYTDGMAEAFNGRKEILGEDESLALFRSVSNLGGCRSVVERLRAKVAEFADGSEQSDDLTLMMYGQLRQNGTVDVGDGRDMSDSLKGDTGVFSLSDLNYALPRPEKKLFGTCGFGEGDETIGQGS